MSRAADSSYRVQGPTTREDVLHFLVQALLEVEVGQCARLHRSSLAFIRAARVTPVGRCEGLATSMTHRVATWTAARFERVFRLVLNALPLRPIPGDAEVMVVRKLKRKRPAGEGFPIGDGALDAALNDGDGTQVGRLGGQNDVDVEGPALAEAFAACLRFSGPHLSTEASRQLPDAAELKELKSILKQLQERIGTLQGSVDTIGERFALIWH